MSSSFTPYAQVDVTKFLPREKYTIVNEQANKLIMEQLSADEKQKLQQFTDSLKGDYSYDVQDTLTLVRFLRARKWNLPEAEKMYRARMVRCTHFLFL